MLQEGLEPPTLGLLDPCSTKLSYQSSCPRSGSNQGPSDLQSDALPTELHGHTQCWEFGSKTWKVEEKKIQKHHVLLAGIEPATPGS